MNTASDTVEARYYVLCLIDILGQKQLLDGWSVLPVSGEPPNRALDAIKKTAGTVECLRNAFAEYFDSFERANPPPEIRKRLSSEGLATYERFKECKLGQQQFSDTFVLYAPLLTSKGDIAVDSVFRMLSAAAMVVIFALAGRVALRGAICIGAGLELDVQNFYGPARAQAHQMESELAQSPRILVSEELVDLLQESRTFSRDSSLNVVAAAMARHCSKFICRDEDGLWIVDFLGSAMSEMNAGDTNFSTAVRQAREFVAGQVDRFKSTNDARLAPRYELLLRYVSSRLGAWNL